ncbi:MAG: hypothetical protein LBQ24_07235 [Candidatus Peribacteria bacterium]|jgi:hypothetical protein|nr:hypothetical protein [Candidatus Peribacteria bacterium]
MSVEIRMTNEKIIQVTACYGKVNNILVNWKTMEEIKKGKKPKTVERVFVSNYEIDASKEELKFID